jgi:hypothetical protein
LPIETVKPPQDFLDGEMVSFVELVNPAVKEARSQSAFNGLRECELEAVIRISHVPGPPGGSGMHVPIKYPEFGVGTLSIDGFESD